MLARIATLLNGYLCGSFLTAEVVSRAWAGRSIFELGDGNPGMANVGHELGLKAALICLAGDILKTVAAVLITGALFPGLGVAHFGWAGLGTTLGHMFPFWHQLKGGKGVTTIASAIILMNPLWGALSGVVGIATIVLTGYLSVGAMVAICFHAVAAFFTLPLECALISLCFVALSLYGHGSKLHGIKDGTTHRASLSTKFWDKMRGKK